MEIIWTLEAKLQYYSVLDYLYEKWGEESVLKLDYEVKKIETLLMKDLITHMISRKLKLHKCVILKRNILIYQKQENSIEILAFINTRTDHKY